MIRNVQQGWMRLVFIIFTKVQTDRHQIKDTMKILYLASLLSGVASQCNENDHHPENDGYYLTGAAGLSNTTNLDSAHGQKLPDNTWAVGL